MSSDDSGFDKEAEREKLREKYERDQEGRENTRRMSELLLQGATMTGKHCNQCGDPIFRYDGQEFCPTCQQAAAGGGAEADATDAPTGNGASEGSATAGETADARSENATDADRTADSSGRTGESATGESAADSTRRADEPADDPASDDEPRVEIDGVRVADRHVDRSDLRQPPTKQGGGRRKGDNRQKSGDGRRSADRRHGHDHDAHGQHDAHGHARDPSARTAASGVSGASAPGAGGSGDLVSAREALVRTVADLARRAEETDDASHARELLAATREAAEAIAALDRANR